MEQLKQEAKQIRDESLANQNTATRVGGWMVRLLERLQEVFQKKIGNKHHVEVETIDYGNTPSSSLTFDGEAFNLKLQIPRGKDGADGLPGESPSITEDGNWQIGDTTVTGTTGYILSWNPENPKINDSGDVVDATQLTVDCFLLSLKGIRTRIQRADWMLVATYKKRHDSGMETTLGTETVTPVAPSMKIPAQKTSGSDKSNKLELTVKEQGSGAIVTSGQVQFNFIGRTGENGTPGGVYIPSIQNGTTLGFQYTEPREGDVPIVFESVRIVPEIDENGYWIIAGQNSGIKGNVATAERLASNALNSAESAVQLAKNAKNLDTNEDSQALEWTTGICPTFSMNKEYLVIDLVQGADNFICAGLLMTVMDKICYQLFHNTSETATLIITLNTSGTVAPASSVSLSPKSYREISYYKSSVTGKTYINYSPEMKEL